MSREKSQLTDTVPLVWLIQTVGFLVTFLRFWVTLISICTCQVTTTSQHGCWKQPTNSTVSISSQTRNNNNNNFNNNNNTVKRMTLNDSIRRACARVARCVACPVAARLRMCDTCRSAKSAAQQTPVGSECSSLADLRCQSTSPRHAAPPQSSLVAGAWTDCV